MVKGGFKLCLGKKLTNTFVLDTVILRIFSLTAFAL